MNYIRQARKLGIVAAVALGVSLAAPAQAEIRQVDGNLWEKSTDAQKDAYLVGMANTLAVYRALQQKNGMVDENSQMNQYLRAVDAGTLVQVRGALDRWYDANPSKLDTPVLGAIWLGVVKARQ